MTLTAKIGPVLQQIRPAITTRMAWMDPAGILRSGEVLDVRTDAAGLPQLVMRWTEGCVQCIPLDARDLRPAPAAPAAVRGGQLGLLL